MNGLRAILAAAVIILLGACAQVQRDGARSFENANSVVRSGTQNLWKTPPADENDQRRRADAPRATPQ